VWWFLRHHKTAAVGVCFLGSDGFSFVDAVWQRTFLAHANIAPMLNQPRCGVEACSVKKKFSFSAEKNASANGS